MSLSLLLERVPEEFLLLLRLFSLLFFCECCCSICEFLFVFTESFSFDCTVFVVICVLFSLEFIQFSDFFRFRFIFISFTLTLSIVFSFSLRLWGLPEFIIIIGAVSLVIISFSSLLFSSFTSFTSF